MKKIIPLFVFVVSFFSFAQSDTSVFANAKDGIYKGTASGVLFVKNTKNQEVILDFQGSEAVVKIIGSEGIEDENGEEQYPYGSRKDYKTTTTSGKTALTYSVLSTANEISMTLAGETYILSKIDGACDVQINGLDFYFKKEVETEYLILTLKKEIILKSEKNNKIIKILPKSVMIFAIKTKN